MVQWEVLLLKKNEKNNLLVGFGVRIMLPMIGIMGLDYGWGLDEIPLWPNANGGQFHFSIGQQF